jgi:hypothetical protein
MLARAFDKAWTHYYLPGRDGALSEDIARPSLAKHLVALVREGIREEDALATAGLEHLISLTPTLERSAPLRAEDRDVSGPQSVNEIASPEERTFHCRIDGATATFLAEWRMQWGRLS